MMSGRTSPEIGPPSRRAVLAGGAAAMAAGGAMAAAASPVVATRHGRVRGFEDGGIKVFKGVRYGADTAPRRFQAPLPPQAWTGVADALDYGASAPQRGERTGEPTSEDCLFLNVWTPSLGDGRRRAVMLYIHGGAYATGSGSGALLDGARLARRGDVVVVTVNHRLNVFGYGYLARLGGATFADSGNAGQLDLILALRWVRDNIAAFGGDPANVMLFGQSGGGAKIATLMGMPAAKGLFHRAATMSGQQVTAGGPVNATRRAEAFMDRLGLKPGDVQALRGLPAERLLDGLSAPDPILGYGSVWFGPVQDDRNLPRHPFFPDANPLGNAVPMMIGNTRDETMAFMGGDATNFTATWDDLPARLAYPYLRVDVAPEKVIAEYRRLYPTYSPSEVLFAATTAGRSWRAAVIEAEERAKAGVPAFVYQQNWRSTAKGGRVGARHGSDIPLVFGNTAAPGADAEGPGLQQMVDQMSESFIAFAKTGDPNNPVIPKWEPYTLPRRRTMVFDVPARMEDDPRGAERRFFDQVPFVQPGT
jgi:para-nitrobenzyl esterase